MDNGRLLMSANEVLIAWLNDAFVMEQGLTSVLKNHVGDAADHPALQQRIEDHLEETRHHAELVRECIESLGGSTSGAKSAMGKLSTVLSALPTSDASDELVKNVICDYAAEHFEIASYQAIIAGARALGHQGIVETCERILFDEERMADWLERNMLSTVQEYLTTQVTV